jgi:DNA polymerase-1
MDSLAARHLERKTITYADVCGKARPDRLRRSGHRTRHRIRGRRCRHHAGLHHAMWPQIEHDDKLRFIYEKIELPTAVVLQKIERNGVLIDSERLGQQSHDLGGACWNRAAGLRAGRPALQPEFAQADGRDPVRQAGAAGGEEDRLGAPSTDEEVLQKLAEDYPLPKVLLEYRSLSKLKSTYTDKLPKMINPATGRVHTNYAQAVAVTGRLASNDPNLQNIPIRTEGRRIREAFVAPEGSVIVSADYSQIELRIMAHISEDENMLKAFANNEDIHRATAAEIFGVAPEQVERAAPLRQGDQLRPDLRHERLWPGRQPGHRTRGRADVHRQATLRFSGVKRYMDETRLQAKARGYVETVFGRRLWLPEINSPNGPRRQGAERAAINAHAGHRCRPHQAGHDRRAGLAGNDRHAEPHDHAGPR